MNEDYQVNSVRTEVNSSDKYVTITPTEITDFDTLILDPDKIIQIACGDSHTMFLTDLGKVYGCGMNEDYQVNPTKDRDDDENELNYIKEPKEITYFDTLILDPDKIIQIACGENHTMFLTETNQVWGYGKNDNYQVYETDNDIIQTPKNNTKIKGNIGIEESDTEIIISGYIHLLTQIFLYLQKLILIL